MDKIIKLFSLRLKEMCQEFNDKVNSMPLWQLDNNLPNEFKQKDIKAKRDFFIEKYKINNPIYKYYCPR